MLDGTWRCGLLERLLLEGGGAVDRFQWAWREKGRGNGNGRSTLRSVQTTGRKRSTRLLRDALRGVIQRKPRCHRCVEVRRKQRLCEGDRFVHCPRNGGDADASPMIFFGNGDVRMMFGGRHTWIRRRALAGSHHDPAHVREEAT